MAAPWRTSEQAILIDEVRRRARAASEICLPGRSAEAIRRKAGARGLRSILEGAMLDVMYELPSRKTAREVLISEEVILKKSEPVVLYSADKDEPKKESA